MNSEILKDLGIAYRAKKVLFANDVLKNMKDIKLVFQANDSSDKSKLRVDKKCYFYKVPIIRDFSSEELSKALGKYNLKLLGIVDDGIVKTILEKL